VRQPDDLGGSGMVGQDGLLCFIFTMHCYRIISYRVEVNQALALGGIRILPPGLPRTGLRLHPLHPQVPPLGSVHPPASAVGGGPKGAPNALLTRCSSQSQRLSRWLA
jgi:hypothetical protein